MKFNKWMFNAVFLFFLLSISGCKQADANIQISPTPQTQPEAQITPTPEEKPNDQWTRQVDEMKMIHIPSGTFKMGSTEAEVEYAIELCQQHYHICNRWYYEREIPIHSVSLDDYWIDRTEISNAQYQLCVESGFCVEPITCKKGEPTFDDPNKDDHPVVCVNWEGAQNYCEWVGSRLPSEAEWEYAFRGQKRSIYTWGDTFDGSRLNYCDANCSQSYSDERFDDAFSHTAPVGSFRSGISWAGVFNLSGNVSEWVSDWFGEYSDEAITNPSGPTTGNEKMIKGCSWFFHPTYCRGSATRYGRS
jgi:formylglycine-generating enzyme required for sulfatase activity